VDPKFRQDLNEMSDTMVLVAQSLEKLSESLVSTARICQAVSKRIDEELKRDGP
jgi:hypothetical protein